MKYYNTMKKDIIYKLGKYHIWLNMMHHNGYGWLAVLPFISVGVANKGQIVNGWGWLSIYIHFGRYGKRFNPFKGKELRPCY